MKQLMWGEITSILEYDTQMKDSITASDGWQSVNALDNNCRSNLDRNFKIRLFSETGWRNCFSLLCRLDVSCKQVVRQHCWTRFECCGDAHGMVIAPMNKCTLV